MNSKKLVCIVLIMVIAGVAYGTQLMTQRAKAMREEAENADMEAHQAATEAEVAQKLLVRTKDETQDLRQFLKEWEPVLQRIQTPQEAESAVLSLVRNSGVVILSQRFDTKTASTNPLIPRILQGSVTVQDEYSKTLTWLGELERKIPFARLTSCRFKQGETGRQLNLEVHIDIPLVDLTAKLEGETPNR